jgi:ribosomal protein S18 acetylase RimI-like enzyme
MNGKHLTLREVRAEELDGVALLIREAYLQYKDYLPPEAWKLYIEDIINVRGRLHESQLIVAESEGKLAGTVTLYLNAALSSQEGWPEGWASIRLLAVSPTYRRRGIGRALMDECVSRCRNKGVRTIGLHTSEMMDNARKLYDSMGFVRAPEFDFYPVPGVVVMAYRLDLKTEDRL